MIAGARQAAERRGRRAERLAALWLAAKGFQVIARRFRAAGGEIDLAVRRGRLLALVEVKARADFDDAVLSVTPPARKRIEAAGRALIAARPHLAEYDLRYDIVAVAGWRVRHFADVWREGDRG